MRLNCGNIFTIKRALYAIAFNVCIAFSWHATAAGAPQPEQPVDGIAGAKVGEAGDDEEYVSVKVLDQRSAREGAVVIESNVMKARISLVGGQLVHVELKKYADAANGRGNAVLLENSATRQFTMQSGLVEHGGDLPDHHASFAVVGAAGGSEGRGGEVTIVSARNGIRLQKRFVLRPNSYSILLEQVVHNGRAVNAAPLLYLQLRHDGRKPKEEGRFTSGYNGPVVYSAQGGYQKMTFSAVDKGTAHHVRVADNGWMAIPQHYFVTALVPPAGTLREIYAQKVGDHAYTLGSKIPLGELRPNETKVVASEIFAGPIDRGLLASTAPGLNLTQDYGWLTFIAEPIDTMLGIAKQVTGNWGWAIILMTVAIRFAFLPISAASQKRMAKIKRLAPRIHALQEKLGGDHAAIHKATMALYREEDINLAAGCLPLLVQLPIFLALYWVLQSSVELRGTPWVGWITDMTQPDPYYILPLLYAASMFATVRLNPKPIDPQKAYLHYAFPLGLSIVFCFMPVGLVLFWIVTNAMTIAQQLYYLRKGAGLENEVTAPTSTVVNVLDARAPAGDSDEPANALPG